MLTIFKKYKERFALAGMVIAFVIFIGGGIYLQKNNQQKKEPLPVPGQVELLKQQEKTAKTASTDSTGATTTTYYLKPSPEELLEQLATMDNLKADVIDDKIAQLPVLWPAYFFALQEREAGRKSVVLDVAENGFGVVLESELDTGLYPQFLGLQAGQKIWLGGKILAVDPTGTGRIYLLCEQFRIGDEGPFVQVVKKNE